MSRRLQIPGEREQDALVAACRQALGRECAADAVSPWPEPASYLAAHKILLDIPIEPPDLDALWSLQLPNGAFPAYWGGSPHVDTSAGVWAAMRISGLAGERVSRLASEVRKLGGVDAFAPQTRLEWALLGLIPADRALHPILQDSQRQGGRTAQLDLREIGGPGVAAIRPKAGFKAWWERTAGAAARQKALARIFDEMQIQASGGTILDPRVRAARLALEYEGRLTPHASESFGQIHAQSFQSGIRATLEAQQSDGSWIDDEGAIHGTWQALLALKDAGYGQLEAEVLRAGEYLRSCQNADGGWGEYGASTVSHTAWALMGLIAGGDPSSESAIKALEFLLEAQSSDGIWPERQWTRVLCPGLAYARDEARANADVRMAIESFLKVATGQKG